MNDESLKNQLELIQNQQKQRLIKKNQLKLKKEDESGQTEKKPSFNVTQNASSDLNGFEEIEDYLDLKLSNHVVSSYKVTESEEYKDLLETVRELRDENGRLHKALGDKELEMDIMKRRWKNEKTELTGTGLKSENAVNKIIEFSKKVRELTADLEKEKTKNAALQRKFDDNVMQLKKQSKPVPTKAEQEFQDIQNELSYTKEKLSQSLLKSAEERNEIEKLKKELKIANKVLTREVGEHPSFQALLNEQAGWRGRQQQILTLQSKVAELQQQLNSRSSSASSSSKLSARNSFLSEGLMNAHLSQYDEKNRLHMRKMELERKEQKEKLQKELSAAMEERDAIKEKLNASKARIQILTKDMKTMKEHSKKLVEKEKHDDELVTALLKEQQYLKQENALLIQENTELKEETHKERIMNASGDIETKQKENETLVEKLQEEIKSQEVKVKELEREVSDLKVRNKPSLIPRPPSGSSKPPSAGSNGSGKGVRRQLSSVNSFGADSLEMQLQETKAISEAAYVEKERLNELVKLLEERNEGFVKDILEKDYHISELKNTNIKLQKKLEKENPKYAKTVNKKERKTQETLKQELLEVETKLSIQMDNNDALKDALATTLRAKEEDFKVCNEMIEQTKKIYLQGIRQYKQIIGK